MWTSLLGFATLISVVKNSDWLIEHFWLQYTTWPKMIKAYGTYRGQQQQQKKANENTRFLSISLQWHLGCITYCLALCVYSGCDQHQQNLEDLRNPHVCGYDQICTATAFRTVIPRNWVQWLNAAATGWNLLPSPIHHSLFQHHAKFGSSHYTFCKQYGQGHPCELGMSTRGELSVIRITKLGPAMHN